MVWQIRKYIIAMFVCVMSCFAMTTQTWAYSIYENGNISSTYLTYFEDIVSKISVFDDYVCFRNGQYEYLLIVGDLELNGSTFTGNGELKEYNITANSGANSYVKFNSYEIHNFSLNASDKILYSNLGHYPLLNEKGDIYNYATLFAFVVMCICMLMRPIFKFCLRFSNGQE